jgi:hypothetical protein
MQTRAEERSSVKERNAQFIAKWKAYRVAKASIANVHHIQEQAIEKCTKIWRGTIRPGDTVWVMPGTERLIRVKVTNTLRSGCNLLCYHSGAGDELPPGWEGMDLIPTFIGNAVAAAAGQSDAAVIMLNNDLRDVMRDAGIAWIAELASAE